MKKTGDFSILEDRALDYESRGREFESSRARHLFNDLQYRMSFAPIVGYRQGTDHSMLADHISTQINR